MSHVVFEAVGRSIPDLRVPVELVHHAGEWSLDRQNHESVRRVVELVVSRMEGKLPLQEDQRYAARPDSEDDSALRAFGRQVSQYSGNVVVMSDHSWDDLRTVLRWSVVAA